MKRLTALTLAVMTAAVLASCGGTTKQKQRAQIGDDIAIAQTRYGKIQGYILDDTYTFLGVPYGAETSGENRFMPPKPPASWDGILPTLYYGNYAPQREPNYNPASVGVWRDHWNYSNASEDCLRLNVWTPALDGKKRPVMVWFHGGGYASGNGIEQDGYHGANFSRYGDVVFCSVNHRLNSFAFSDFSGTGDEKFRSSGNVGFLDMVAALQWVHDNIENFGGDPGNVTIMGQSGGGAKVSTLVASPETAGLVHKAVALSGNATSGLNKTYAQNLGLYILQEAGLKPGEVNKLQEMPWQEYFALANRAATKFAAEYGGANVMRGGFSPVADGIHIPAGTFYADQSQHSNNIPMIFCTTNSEYGPGAALENITFEELPSQMSYPAETAHRIIEAYKKAYPGIKPVEILCRLASSRERVVETANAKYVQSAPVYMAQFGWEPNLLDGRMRAFHCVDISFWFRNTDLMWSHTGGSSEADAMSKKMADALLSFMRTGDPNTKSLPAWPRYTPEKGELMFFNDECEVQADPDREVRQIIAGAI